MADRKDTTRTKLGSYTFERGRVLVLEDELAARASLEAVLSADFDVETAPTVGEAIFAARRTPVDVVVADFDLGAGERGSSALEEIGKLCPSMSGILLTGHTDYADVRAIQKEGRWLVMFKPADPEQVLAWVKNGVVMSRLFKAKVPKPTP